MLKWMIILDPRNTEELKLVNNMANMIILSTYTYSGQ